MLARLARRTRRTVRLLSDDAAPAVPPQRIVVAVGGNAFVLPTMRPAAHSATTATVLRPIAPASPNKPVHMMLRGGGVSGILSAINTAADATSPGLLLSITIVFEVFATVCMKMAATGPSIWYAGVGAGYALCFSIFPLALRRMPLSIAYATWSGAGTAASVLIGRMLFGERLTWMKVFHIFLIIGGVVGLNH